MSTRGLTGSERLSGPARDDVRMKVKETLHQTRSFNTLPKTDQDQIAHNMVKVMSFLTEAGTDPALLPMVSSLGVGSAARAGEDTMRRYVKDVNFPHFVAGLIRGVFQSIVQSSIQQMREYGKFLESVVKSVEEFANDHVKPDEARDYLAGKYPNALEKKQGENGSKLALKDGVDDGQLPDFKTLFNLAQAPDLSDDEGEQKLVASAQLQMAKQRQQLLATMVLLGINRIVVTEGEIKASVVFDVTSHEKTTRDSERDSDRTATDGRNYNEKFHADAKDDGGGASFDESYNAVQTTVSTSHAQDSTSSEATLDAKAKLTGSVLVKFKSETFPLERMASPMELAGVQQKAQR